MIDSLRLNHHGSASSLPSKPHRAAPKLHRDCTSNGMVVAQGLVAPEEAATQQSAHVGRTTTPTASSSGARGFSKRWPWLLGLRQCDGQRQWAPRLLWRSDGRRLWWRRRRTRLRWWRGHLLLRWLHECKRRARERVMVVLGYRDIGQIGLLCFFE